MSSQISDLRARLEAEVEKRDQKIDSVYIKLDEHYQTLDKKIDTKFEHLSGQITAIPSMIMNATKQTNGNGKSNVVTVALALSLIVTITLALWQNSQGQITSMTTAMERFVDKTDARFTSLDNNLQREMRDVSAVRQAEIEGLDTALQREMRLLSAIQEK